MFNKVLIANRGEIALRVICACRELGIETVAVYSTADEHSLHVRFADEAICVGPPRSFESYLNIPSIISAAEISNVDAIHPGYGYLAESDHFAEVCETCGITFIGPAPESIRLMGDKAEARKRMQEEGLPIIPGSGLIGDERPDDLEQMAAEVGFPLIIKAVAGGGGRGMRIVREPGELDEAISTAQSEAASAFGDAGVYMERYLENPRHIEFQILADHYGNAVHLGERECSVQRRHQKLIEESPSPAVSNELREEMGARVVDAVKRVGYRNAGTIEFLLDETGEFFFIEMNTRIQVEHPVTEAITGIDLVKAQLRIAAGEQLGYSQDDITFTGHSIECRIIAEDPETLMPSPGLITADNPPGGPGIRVDSTAYSGWDVSPHYDSMIAKLISWGRDRDEAIARIRRALDMYVIEGPRTSIPLHARIVRHPVFVGGDYTTSFLPAMLEEEKSDGG